jgi:hypothetical protein
MPQGWGRMRIISFIEDDRLIRKILMHLGLWETRNQDPPAPNAAHIPTVEY